MQKPYPIYDQNGRKTIPFGSAHTYIAHIREYRPPPPSGGGFGTLSEFGSTLLARWPIVELALELEIKTSKTYKSRSKLGCHKNLRPLEFILKKDLHGKFVSLLVSRFVYGHAMFVGNSQKDRSEIFIFSGLSLSMSG